MEDNPETVDLITINLEMEGYQVASALNGSQGLKRAYELPDIILLDVMMPDIDGWQVCRQLKHNNKTRDILVIMLTAMSSSKDILKGFQMGADEFVTKPFNVEELLARVRSMVRIKKGLDELKGLNLALEEKVAEKTASLMLANERLSLLEKAKNDFLVLLTHELRTPLNGIIGFAELLLNDLISEDQIESCHLILESGERLLRLSDTAVLLTSLKTDKYDLLMEEVQIDKILKEVINSLIPVAEGKKIEIEDRINIKDPIKVKGDLKLIKRCLFDVLNNAVEFSPEKGSVLINMTDKDNDLHIEIQDDGPGFSEDVLKYIFEPFCKDNIGSHHEGTGLGLYVSKIIMEAHQGEIKAENRREGGAVVRLTFKICQSI
ncbi:MAG: hybrid sensor histidine kinase/response regulator [Thermodesulfobacteriota bacterium]|nr:hybrid sensor histidine kinase/response regulator [Thermodesulfobacteriota bacterium]